MERLRARVVYENVVIGPKQDSMGREQLFSDELSLMGLGFNQALHSLQIVTSGAPVAGVRGMSRQLAAVTR
jgi:hypothetical protein